MSTQTLTSDAQALVDAVADDLEGNVVFPVAYRLHRYLEPVMVTPEMCPVFVVALSPDTPADVPVLVGSAGCYDHEWHLIVQWWEAAGEAGDDLLAMRLLAVTQELMDRIKAWSKTAIPGISNRYGLLEGGVAYSRDEGFCWHSSIPVVVNPRA